jgi:soluble lytic murein transglycosylase-like protein
MKLVWISAITASACLAATASPTFAQSTPAEAADLETAKSAAQEARAPIVVRRKRSAIAPEQTTAGIAPVVAAPAPVVAAPAVARGRPYDSMIASHAASNGIPVELVHRVVVRESRYRADARGRGGATGLMQIKLATARSMGYSGSAAGLLDPETNLTYGVRYLAGAYRAASGNHGRAVGYYASGYRGARMPASAYARALPQQAVFATAGSAEPAMTVEPEVRRKKRR